jgi:hypothetical protein
MSLGTLTANEWLSQFHRDVPIRMINDGILDPFDPEYTAADWVSGKEIRVLSMPGISSKATRVVKGSIKEVIDELHLDFDINVYDLDRSTKNLIECHISRNGLDYEGLSRALAIESYRKPHLGGSQHADVILIPEFFDDDKVSWGVSRFSRGNILFALPNGRPNNLSFLRKIAKHESGHLLGYHLHHEDFSVPELDAKYCVMDPSVPTDKVCDKCFNAINNFWMGLEKVTGDKYIRDGSPYRR